jgi:hypothetical protein
VSGVFVAGVLVVAPVFESISMVVGVVHLDIRDITRFGRIDRRVTHRRRG